MPEFVDLSPGSDAAARLFSSRWINHVTRAANRTPLEQGRGVEKLRRPFVPVVVLNDSGAAIDAPFPILRLTTPVVTIADNANAPYNEAEFKAATPDATTGGSFVIAQGPLADDRGGVAALLGLSWAKVDVASETDTHATTIDGDNTKLQSGGSGAEIKWKEAGTGEKWALVLLGGGGGDPIVYGRLVETVDADSTLADAIELETFAGWFESALDELDAQIVVHAGNPSLYSAYRGSATDPVRVWGVMKTASVVIDAVPTDVSTFIIHGEFKDQLAAAYNFVTSPDNDKGQALIHNDGSRATVADGGPCGGA